MSSGRECCGSYTTFASPSYRLWTVDSRISVCGLGQKPEVQSLACSALCETKHRTAAVLNSNNLWAQWSACLDLCSISVAEVLYLFAPSISVISEVPMTLALGLCRRWHGLFPKILSSSAPVCKNRSGGRVRAANGVVNLRVILVQHLWSLQTKYKYRQVL